MYGAVHHNRNGNGNAQPRSIAAVPQQADAGSQTAVAGSQTADAGSQTADAGPLLTLADLSESTIFIEVPNNIAYTGILNRPTSVANIPHSHAKL